MKSDKTAEKAPKVPKNGSRHVKLNQALIILLLMALVLAGAWLLSRQAKPKIAGSAISARTLMVGDYKYTVDFASDAKEVNKGNTKPDQPQPWLEGKLGKTSITLAINSVPWPVIADCGVVGPGFKQAFTAQINGKDYKVCQQNNLDYITVFELNGQKHQIGVSSSDNTTKLSVETVRSIIESVSVAKQ